MAKKKQTAKFRKGDDVLIKGELDRKYTVKNVYFEGKGEMVVIVGIKIHDGYYYWTRPGDENHGEIVRQTLPAARLLFYVEEFVYLQRQITELKKEVLRPIPKKQNGFVRFWTKKRYW